MKTSDFDYELPPERIAQEPPKERDGGRMMVLDRAKESITHAKFTDLPVIKLKSARSAISAEVMPRLRRASLMFSPSRPSATTALGNNLVCRFILLPHLKMPI